MRVLMIISGTARVSLSSLISVSIQYSHEVCASDGRYEAGYTYTSSMSVLS
jgi:hypothetical protein